MLSVSMRSVLVALAGACVCLLCVTSRAQAQDTLYVAPVASGSCTAWDDACDLQEALGRATGSDEVWIAEGTYTPGTRSEDSFTITGAQDGLTIYGGFGGDETARHERDLSDHETLLSANIGTPDIEDNSYQVLVVDGTGGSGPSNGRVTPATVLDGVTITGADADGFNDNGFGGGLYCDGAGAGNECSPTLRNVAFVKNKAFRGGAIYNNGRSGGESSPRITNATFIGNRAENGGAVYNNGRTGRSSPRITNATFIDNRATSSIGSADGGAIYNSGFDGGTSSPQITNTILWGNAADGEGDALAGVDASPSITYSLVEGRTPSGTGNLDGTDAGNAPSFVSDNDAEGPYDLRLFEESTAIDAGTNAPFASGGVAEGVTRDRTGDDRIQDGDGDGTATVTIGAYETAIGDFVDLRLTTTPTAVAGAGPDALTVRLANQGTVETADAAVALDVPSGVTLTKTSGAGTLSGGTWAAGPVPSGAAVALTAEVERTGNPVDAPARTATVQDGYVPAGASDITISGDEKTPWAVLAAPYGAGRALAPQDTGDYVSADAASDTLAGTDAFTLEAWVAPANGADRPAVLAFNGTTDDNKNILFYDSGRFQYYDADISFQTSTDTYPEGQWHHVAVVIAADDSGTLYVNGTEQATFTTGVRPVAGGHFSIGQEWDTDTPSDYFQGRIDEVRLWDTARTVEEVRGAMHRTVPGPAGTAGLVGYWRFDGDRSGTAYDYAGPAAGTVNGTPPRVGSGAPLGQQAALASGGQTRAVGPPGGTVQVGNASATGADTLALYQYGTADGALIDGTADGEDFSNVSADRRLNVVWGLEPAAEASATATVTFDFSGIAGVNDPAQVRLLTRAGPGTAWQDVTADWTLDAGAKTFSRSGLSAFSQYAVAGTAQALPVELAGVEATVDGQAVTLTWQTVSETGNAGFDVQRREDEAWATVGFVESRVEGGTTTEAQRYRFVDRAVPLEADSLTYRLRQVDTDGTASYTDPVTVARRAVERVRLLGTYPNPVRSWATVRFAIPEGASQDIMLRLYDVLGREVRTMAAPAEAGRHTLQLDTSRLPSGTYFLRLQAGTTAKTQQVTVVR